jgi:hypothetical protein
MPIGEKITKNIIDMMIGLTINPIRNPSIAQSLFKG